MSAMKLKGLVWLLSDGRLQQRRNAFKRFRYDTPTGLGWKGRKPKLHFHLLQRCHNC